MMSPHLAEVHAKEVGVDVVAVSMIIYLKVLIMLFGFITINSKNIYLQLKATATL